MAAGLNQSGFRGSPARRVSRSPGDRRPRDDIRTRPGAGMPGHPPGMGMYDDKHVHGMHMVHDGPREAPPLVLIHE